MTAAATLLVASPLRAEMIQEATQEITRERTVDLGTVAQPEKTSVRVLVELREEPAAKTYARILGDRPLSTANRAAASAATASQAARIREEQEPIAAALRSPAINGTELFRASRSLNAIAALVDSSHLAALRAMPAVKAVHLLDLEYPHNDTSVPFLRAPAVWANSVGARSGATGAGIRIGIIDSGIDYQHATFGGSGLLADYQANDRTAAPDTFFPNAKVAGGIDLAGDAYNGSNAPQPDADPMDCQGHGTHVAATAAGFGVKNDGTPFTGPFDESVPFGNLRVGPGTAPRAQLYAIRVFGCSGATTLTIPGIEWALDPNGDNDLSDHLDVINLSLGTEFGSLANTTAIAADNAASAGVIVVASAGNSGDTYFVSGSLAAGNRVIAVAGSVDSGEPYHTLSVTSPSSIAGSYATTRPSGAGAVSPPAGGLSSAVVRAQDAANGNGPSTTDGCSALTNAAAVAGNVALIDVGTCSADQKALNAQNAGAIAAILVHNINAAMPIEFTLANGSVSIPVVMVSNATGSDIAANLPVQVTLATKPASDTIYASTSRGPRNDHGILLLKPDISAPAQNIVSARTGVTCMSGDCLSPDPSGFAPHSQAVAASGTSMAAAHVAGIMALLRQLHPIWTVEELKALAMNTALHDITTAPHSTTRYGAARVGAGRISPELAAPALAVAFNADDRGLVSVSFDGAIPGIVTRTKKVRLVNHGTTAQTFDLGIDTVIDAPGVDYTIPGVATVTIQPSETIELDVQMRADASLMKRSRDETVDATQSVGAPLGSLGALSRHWLTEESGFLTFSQAGSTRLRVPLYAALTPVSDMQTSGTLATNGASTGTAPLTLSGTPVCTGTLTPGDCSSTTNDIVSIVTPFQLQVVSRANPAVAPGFADLQYAGVSYNASANVLNFGISTWAPWASPSDVTFNVYIDNNNDGTFDRVLFNASPGIAAARLFGNTAQKPTDTFITFVFNIATSGVSTQQFVNGATPTSLDTRLFNNQVITLSATPASLGLTPGMTSFRYKILTCPGNKPLCREIDQFAWDEEAGPYQFDYANPGLQFSQGSYSDLPDDTIPTTFDISRVSAQNVRGALLLHHHNAEGHRAEVVALDTMTSNDLGITLSASSLTPLRGTPTTLTLIVTNHGSLTSSGTQVKATWPPALTYESDDAGGLFNSSTGIWNLHALAPGASETLRIQFTANQTGPFAASAQITNTTLLDTNLANNVATLDLTTGGQADLRITAVSSSPSTASGGSVTYTIALTNIGDDTAYNVLATYTFTAGSGAIVHATPSLGRFDAATRGWTLASLGAGTTATLTLTIAVNAGPALTLRASASSTLADPNLMNNVASATTSVPARSTMVVATVMPSTVTVGDGVTMGVMVMDVEPLGPKGHPAGQVAFSSPLPSDTFSSATCVLVPVPLTIDQSSCSILVTPTLPGTRQLTASYAGSVEHAAGVSTPFLIANEVPETPEPEKTYVLAEGATGPFFDYDLVMANPNSSEAPIVIKFFKEGGEVIQLSRTLLPTSRTTIRVDDIAGLASASVSTLVSSTTGLPIVVERTMWWGAEGYGAHTEKAQDALASTWYFAEGAEGFFSTFFLLANPSAAANIAHVTYMREMDSPVTRDYPMTPWSRLSIDAGSDPELAGRTFGAIVTFDQPAAAERAMYFGDDPLWLGGHESAGAVTPSTVSYFAEGATGTYFSTFLLLANPGNSPASIAITYFPSSGGPVERAHTLEPHARLSIDVAAEHELLRAASFGARISSDLPIVAERSQYWGSPDWIESHNSGAVPEAALRWGLAEGRVGGPAEMQTYVLLLNPGDQPSTVTMKILRTNGTTLETQLTVPAASRATVSLRDELPALADNETFGLDILSSHPIVVERSMYGNTSGLAWSTGTNATGTRLPIVP